MEESVKNKGKQNKAENCVWRGKEYSIGADNWVRQVISKPDFSLERSLEVSTTAEQLGRIVSVHQACVQCSSACHPQPCPCNPGWLSLSDKFTCRGFRDSICKWMGRVRWYFRAHTGLLLRQS